jgi:DNA end-binding protein Ku
LNADDHTPVRYQWVSPSTGEEVPWSDIVKGYEYTKGKFIVLTDEDFKAAALESSRSIDICDFVPETEIDPRFFETPYFVVPSKGGEKAYALLREAMRETSSVGIGKIIMRQSQHLAGLHVVGDALVLELMRFATEVVDPNEYAFPRSTEVRPAERSMAVQLVQSLAASFEPSKYTDDYRANLMRIINAKAKGKKVVLEAPEKEGDDGKVLDLMSRLQESLERGKTRRGRSTNGAVKPAARRAPKSKVASKRARHARSA